METQVFITNYAAHDYTKAEVFGKLVFITKGYVSFQSLDRVLFQCGEVIIKSHKDDHLLISGATSICIMCALLWFQQHGQCKLLVYDAKARGEYREMKFTPERLIQLSKALNTLGSGYDGSEEVDTPE